MPEVKDLLEQMKNGALGAEKKKRFEKFCGDKDLSELADLYEIERQLWIILTNSVTDRKKT